MASLSIHMLVGTKVYNSPVMYTSQKEKGVWDQECRCIHLFKYYIYQEWIVENLEIQHLLYILGKPENV